VLAGVTPALVVLRRHATVILHRVEVSLANGPDVALIAIPRQLRVRDSVQRFDSPVAVGPRLQYAPRLHGTRQPCTVLLLRNPVRRRERGHREHGDQEHSVETQPLLEVRSSANDQSASRQQLFGVHEACSAIDLPWSPF